VNLKDGSPYIWTAPVPKEGEEAEETPKESLKEKIMGKKKVETGNSISRCTYSFTL
jgi:hypothetical protein